MFSKEKMDEFRRKRKIWFYNLKKTKQCQKCGENHPACLDFHHRDSTNKKYNIGLMVSQNYSKKKILTEIEKCDILCSNCHRKLHFEDRDIDELIALDKISSIKKLIQEWIDKQGHDRCWYYPNIFKEIADILEIKQHLPSCLPPKEEFENGCKRYQEEEYLLHQL